MLLPIHKVDLEDVVLPEHRTPERILIQKENISGKSLSNDALQVLQLVLASPTNVLNALQNSYGKITKHTLRLYLTRQKKWHHINVNIVFAELKDFVGGF